MMTMEEMRQRQKEENYSYEKLGKLTGFSEEKVRKNMEEKETDYSVLKAMEEVFASKPALVIREARAEYLAQKKQGEFTLDDYYALPDERRVELIDGVIYDMAAPTNIHQLIGGEIYIRFYDYIRKHKGKCIPAYAPFDVQLDCDNKTMVQPDLMIVCDRDKLYENKLYGAPDLVVEILSKSTGKKDTILKLNKYMDAGVREYWIVDPRKKKVIVYDFQSDGYPVIYGFEDHVPVGIFGGECKVNFSEVYEAVRFLYERE